MYCNNVLLNTDKFHLFWSLLIPSACLFFFMPVMVLLGLLWPVSSILPAIKLFQMIHIDKLEHLLRYWKEVDALKRNISSSLDIKDIICITKPIPKLFIQIRIEIIKLKRNLYIEKEILKVAFMQKLIIYCIKSLTLILI